MLVSFSVGIQSCLPRYLTFCMKGKHWQCASTVSGLIPSLLHSLYLSLHLANRASLSSAISLALALCSRSLLLRSLSCLHMLPSVFISNFTKQQLRNYGYKACIEITCSSRSMTDRQITSTFTSQRRGSLRSPQLCVLLAYCTRSNERATYAGNLTFML